MIAVEQFGCQVDGCDVWSETVLVYGNALEALRATALTWRHEERRQRFLQLWLQTFDVNGLPRYDPDRAMPANVVRCRNYNRRYPGWQG